MRRSEAGRVPDSVSAERVVDAVNPSLAVRQGQKSAPGPSGRVPSKQVVRGLGSIGVAAGGAGDAGRRPAADRATQASPLQPGWLLMTRQQPLTTHLGGGWGERELRRPGRFPFAGLRYVPLAAPTCRAR
jgi:hypothetical protein